MNDEDERLCSLPRKRTGLRVEWLASWSMWRIGAGGLGLYIAAVAIASAVGWLVSRSGQPWIRDANDSLVGWWDIVYFNFITILTIGYGDYSPVGASARFFAVFEAVLGTGILGITIAALTAKFLSPPSNAIVFSRHAYYCTDDEKLLVIFVNTTRNRLVNAEISSFFKLGGDWEVRPAVRSPFITRAVQTFFTDHVCSKCLVAKLNEASDAYRFGISGQLGGASFSAAIEYKPSDIIVLTNRKNLTTYPGFWSPDFECPQFREMFHYSPAGALTLTEFVAMQQGHREVESSSAAHADNGVPDPKTAEFQAAEERPANW